MSISLFHHFTIILCWCVLVFHILQVNCCKFSPNGELIATASDDKTVKLWKVSTGQCVHTFSGHTAWVHSRSNSNKSKKVRSCCFSSDGKLIASASGDKTIRLWNVESRKCIKTLMNDTSVFNVKCLLMFKVLCCSFSSNDEFIVSGGLDCIVKVWNVDTGICIRVFKEHTNTV